MAEISARVDRLQALGIKLPTLEPETLDNLIFKRDDLKALIGAILVSRHQRYMYNLREVLRDLFIVAPVYPYRYESFDKGACLRSTVSEMFPLYLSTDSLQELAYAMSESSSQIVDRLYKFQVLGLQFEMGLTDADESLHGLDQLF